MTALDISRWFIMRSQAENKQYESELITPMKLQKLLYYAQGVYFAYNKNGPLFDDDFLAWEHGPVIKSVYDVYNGGDGIKYVESDGDEEIFDNIEANSKIYKVLNAVYDKYGSYTASYLRNKTHNETPWKTTDGNDIIAKEKIKSYFLRVIR